MIQENLNGWLLLNKPEGISSAKALSLIKFACKPRKVGHAGTLDPFASGLLLVAVGEATKTMQFAMEQDKIYEFSITWGASTNTGDCYGEFIDSSDNKPSMDDIQGVLKKFIGQQMQVPHAFSANLVNGKRAYKIAREGGDVELNAKKVEVKWLKIKNHEAGITDFEIRCSKGFYIRSLARDIAAELGVCAYVSSLKRTRIGKFDVGDAIVLEKLEKIEHNERRNKIKSLLLPVSAVLDDILVLQCDEVQAEDIIHGRPIPNEKQVNLDGLVLAKRLEKPLAICRVQSELLYPIRVFNL